jgi:DNA polymerase
MQEGFFSIKDIQSATYSSRAHTCATCGLYKHVLSPKMEPFGNFKSGILNIGEAPGETEDIKGKQWQGKVGMALRQAYAKLGVDLFEDCLNFNAINCRPTDKVGNNRVPSPNEILCCRQRVLKVIAEYKPKLIVLLGGSAIRSVIGCRWKHDLGAIGRWRGWTIPDRELNAWVCPTFHPSFVERGEKEIETIWMQDLERALCMIKEPLLHETEKVEIVEDLSFLPDLKGPVAFDYETTGLKPHNESRHQIICMSICNHPGKAFTFMIPQDREQRRNIRLFLKSDIPKIAQNMKFEHTWTYNQFHCEVQNWTWDTMLATHIIDNRPDVTSLKFQVYVNFGLADYSSEITPYLSSKGPKNGNEPNHILELCKSADGRRKLLTYCGLDSIFEWRLAMLQQKLLGVK